MPLHYCPVVSEYMSYEIPYVLRLLQCRFLVSNKLTVYRKNAYAYLPMLREVKN